MTRRLPSTLAVALALGLAVWAWTFRTGAVGGSDSACYALMARMYAEGASQPRSVLAEEAPWPEPTRVAAPAGFLPSVTRPGAAVPVCAPGYSLLLAPLVLALGPDAVHLVPAVAAGLLVWLAFVLARRLSTPAAGVAAAALVATTPIVLFQAVQPMNDITTGALWLGVAAAMCVPRPALTGLLVGIAVLVRPNLVIGGAAAIVGAAWVAASAVESARTARFVRALITGGLMAAPGVALAMALNWTLYGSPLQSGYGDLGVLFAGAHVPVNLARYGWTWIATGTPLVLLAPLAWWVVPPHASECGAGRTGAGAGPCRCLPGLPTVRRMVVPALPGAVGGAGRGARRVRAVRRSGPALAARRPGARRPGGGWGRVLHAAHS